MIEQRNYQQSSIGAGELDRHRRRDERSDRGFERDLERSAEADGAIGGALFETLFERHRVLHIRSGPAERLCRRQINFTHRGGGAVVEKVALKFEIRIALDDVEKEIAPTAGDRAVVVEL